MVKIRSASQTDKESWLELRCALWPDDPIETHRREIDSFFNDELKQPAAVLLAENPSGEITGFAELSIRTYAQGCDTSQVAYLEGWFVEEESRRQGIGSALVKAAEDWGREKGCKEFASDAHMDNEISKAAHLGSGFEEAGLIRCFKKEI